MVSALFPDAQNAAVVFLQSHTRVVRPFCLYLLLSEHSEFFSTRYYFRLYSFIFTVRFLIGALLITYRSYCWLCTFRRFEILPEMIFCGLTLSGKSFVWDWALSLREPLDPSCFSRFSPFFPFMLYFLYCCNNCLLLPPVNVLILMDPNGLPL